MFAKRTESHVMHRLHSREEKAPHAPASCNALRSRSRDALERSRLPKPPVTSMSTRTSRTHPHDSGVNSVVKTPALLIPRPPPRDSGQSPSDSPDRLAPADPGPLGALRRTLAHVPGAR